MKNFDLEKAINGAPLVTRDGRDVTEFHYFKSAAEKPIRAVINGSIITYDENGIHFDSSICLFLKSEKKKLFVAIYKNAEQSSAKWHINAAYSCTDMGMLKSRYDLSEKNWQIVEMEIDV